MRPVSTPSTDPCCTWCGGDMVYAEGSRWVKMGVGPVLDSYVRSRLAKCERTQRYVLWIIWYLYVV